MTFLWGLFTVVAMAFLYISLRGAPYVPTLKREVQRALDVADVQPGTTVVDLGSGDGRLLLAAARRGCKAVGYELNPLLALYSWARTYSVRKQVSVSIRDFWHAPLPDSTDVVFVFLAKPFMKKLDAHMSRESQRLNKRLVLISFGFEPPGREAAGHDGAVYRYEFTPDKALQP